MAQPNAPAAQSLDQVAYTLEELKNVLERIARALESTGAD